MRKNDMERVLVLSLEKEFFNSVQTNLSEYAPVEVKTFTNCLDLMEQFLARYTCLVILDIDLVQQNVIKLIRILRAIQRETKIILLLSRDNMSFCSAALSLGVISYQIKPISLKSTCEIIGTTLQLPIKHN